MPSCCAQTSLCPLDTAQAAAMTNPKGREDVTHRVLGGQPWVEGEPAAPAELAGTCAAPQRADSFKTFICWARCLGWNTRSSTGACLCSSKGSTQVCAASPKEEGTKISKKCCLCLWFLSFARKSKSKMYEAVLIITAEWN